MKETEAPKTRLWQALGGPFSSVPFSSVQSLSHVWLFVTPWTAAPRIPCPSPTPRAYSNSCPSSPWCHPTISSSVVAFSSWFSYLPASESFLMTRLFASGGQSIGASVSVLPVNIQSWFPLGLTGLISLLSRELESFPALQFKSINSSEGLIYYKCWSFLETVMGSCSGQVTLTVSFRSPSEMMSGLWLLKRVPRMECNASTLF